ncbi:MAG: Rab family GTPase [Promethearchaeota archaeon]
MTIEEVKKNFTKEYVFKIVLLGDAAVGKTSLITQYCEGMFEEDYKPTLGANIIRKDVNLEDVNTKVRLIMWDLAGQEKYSVIRSMYFQGCVGAFLVYDITRYHTFDSINSKWLKDFKRYVKKEGAYILIGNKSDLKDQRAVTAEKGKTLAGEIKASDFIETSAKLGENIEEAFSLLVHQILRNHGIKV